MTLYILRSGDYVAEFGYLWVYNGVGGYTQVAGREWADEIHASLSDPLEESNG